jgi:peptide/nickel transport system permease protein
MSIDLETNEPLLISGGALLPGLNQANGNRGAASWGRAVLRSSISMKIGAALLASYVLVIAVSLFWTPYDPNATGVGLPLLPPDGAHWFGTDRLGSDVFSRVMAATATDMGITIAAVGIALLVGTFLGTVAGYFGGAWDMAIMRPLEVLQAFPTLLLAMLIVVAIGPGIPNVIVVVATVGIPGYLRLARAEILSKRTWQYAEAARMVGGNSWRVAFRHLLPNSMAPLLAFAAINAAWVAVIVASLGFIGVGIQPGAAEWGAMISAGQDEVITGSWWISFFPGLAILGLAGAFYMVSDGLLDGLDPKTIR